MSEMPPASAPASGLEPHRGVLVLVLGILSIVICGIILGPIAFFLGKGDLAKMDAGQMDPEGRGLTKAGYICGIVGTVLHAAIIILQVLFFIIGMGAAAANG